MKVPLCIATWCVILVACAASSLKHGYIFTSPRSLKIGSENELQFLRFGDLTTNGNLRVRLYYTESYDSNETLAYEQDYDLQSGQQESLFQFQVNRFTDNYVYNGRLEINGTLGEKKFGGSDKIQFSTPKNKILLIQTDKPLYQPGQEVKFRVLKLDKELKASLNNDDIGEVFVEDPKGTRLFQFKNVHLGNGIVQKSFPLSDDPVLGTWRITVNSQNDSEVGTLEVKRYVLPKFDVKIKFPPFVLANTDLIPVEICAKYTYGKNVIGTLNLNATVESYYWSNDKNPVLQETFKIDGCYNYTLNSSLIQSNSYRYRRIMVVANVVEQGTGVQMNATEYLQRQYSPLNLNFNSDANQRQYFKPGLPYTGKLKVTNPDDTPAGCEQIEICATISRERVISNWFGTRKVKFCKNYTSDDDGIVKYALPPQNTDSTSIYLEARSIKYAKKQNSGNNDDILNTPQTSTSLSPYFSPSGNFIQLTTVGGELPCGAQQSVRLLYTSKEDADYEFYYEVIKQGEVVQTGTSKVSFTTADDVSNKFNNEDELINDSETQLVPSPDNKMPNYLSSSSSEEDDCPAAKEARYVPPIGETEITVNIDPDLSPSFTLLVFYVRPDKETVADSQKFQVQKCFKNKVDFEFGDEVKQPGTKTSVKVTSSPNSLCGIKVVDKSVSLLDSSDQLTADRVFQLLENMDSNIYYSTNPCNDKVPQPGLYATSSKTSIIRPPGSYSSSSYEDSLSAFKDSGFLVISNLILFTRPCSNGGGYGGSGYGPVFQAESVSFAGAPGGPGGAPRPVALASVARRPAANGVSADAKVGTIATKSAVEVRDYFPETWLFKMELTGPDGVFVHKERLPHTITEWIGSAACISPTDGLGISNKTSIKGFQAFFISYTLPVSVIRGEEFWIVVSIFNYVDGALPITVSLDHPEGFEVTSDSINGEVCVKPDESSNLRIRLKATKVGKVNITVRAESAPNSEVCKDLTVSDAYAKDAITQPLTVDAEGYPQETFKNSLFCPTDNEDQKFSEPYNVGLPDDVVPDSYRAYMDVTGNVMGPAIKNLNDLVALPTGCGEQNMVKFTPNYLVLDYLKDIGKLTDSIRSTAIRNLNTGYQRELNYKHSDGSFSAFGEVDKEGSMFLTAFVLRSFYEAKRYINIDDSLITQMQNWIASKQADDGHFPNVGRIIDYGLQGGIEKEKNDGGITAYALTSLLLSDYENETVINKAKAYLNEVDSNLTPYETFLFAYAEAVAGDVDAAKKKIDQIKPRANTTDGLEFYNNPNGTKSLNLETVAYAVLANLKVGNGAAATLPLVRYMSQNLNPNGGFYSTQDTCVGLDGLSKFAKLVYKDPVDILVSVSGDVNDSFEVSEDNKLLVQRKKIPQVPSNFLVEATGSGCGLVQVALRYNTFNSLANNVFQLGVTTECLGPDCKRGKINIAVSYIPEGKAAGMSVVEINMISGTVPVKESLEQLITDSKNILRTDVEGNKAIIYLAEVTNAFTQFSFEVEKVIDVENVQPANIKVYDYYTPENVESTNYTFEESAGAASSEATQEP